MKAHHILAPFALLLIFVVCTQFASCFAFQKSSSPIKREVSKLISEIDKVSDNKFSKADITPSVDRLVEIGLPSLQYGVLDLLLSDDPHTVLYAWRVLNDVVCIEFGYIPGQGWQDDKLRQEMSVLWKENGALLWNSPKEVRALACSKWKEWVSHKISEEREIRGQPESAD